MTALSMTVLVIAYAITASSRLNGAVVVIDATLSEAVSGNPGQGRTSSEPSNGSSTE